MFLCTIMFLWRTFELKSFARMIRQLRCPFALEAAALHCAALRLLHLRQYTDNTSANRSSCNTQKQSQFFQCEWLHTHLILTDSKMLRVLELARPSMQPSRALRNRSHWAAVQHRLRPMQHAGIALPTPAVAVYPVFRGYRASSVFRRCLRHQSSARFVDQSLRQC